MTQENLEILAQQAAAGDQTASDALLGQMQAILRQLDQATRDRVVRAALQLNRETDSNAPSPATPAAPELLEWARRQSTEEELVAEIRELREQGGSDFEELLRDIEPQADRQ
jgi:hypothetical protein